MPAPEPAPNDLAEAVADVEGAIAYFTPGQMARSMRTVLDALAARLASPAQPPADDPVATSGLAWRRARAVPAARADADHLNAAILQLLPPALEFRCDDCTADPCRCDPGEQARVDAILAAWAGCGWDTRRAASLARLAARALAPEGDTSGVDAPTTTETWTEYRVTSRTPNGLGRRMSFGASLKRARARAQALQAEGSTEVVVESRTVTTTRTETAWTEVPG